MINCSQCGHPIGAAVWLHRSDLQDLYTHNQWLGGAKSRQFIRAEDLPHQPLVIGLLTTLETGVILGTAAGSSSMC